MATTTNFGWETPDDTDLVKDGAAAIRTALGGVDTSFLDLKGGTSGQVLSKNTDTDLDFLWINPSGGSNWSLLNTGGTSLTGATSVTVSGISAKDKIMVLISGASADANAKIGVRLNGSSSSVYAQMGFYYRSPSSYATGNLLNFNSEFGTNLMVGQLSSNAGSTVSGAVTFSGCSASGVKAYALTGSGDSATGNGHEAQISQGFVNLSAAITSITVRSDSANLDAGTVYVYTSTQ